MNAPSPGQPARTPGPGGQTGRTGRWLLVPVLAFAGMAAMLGFALTGGDPSKLPSALLGKQAPAVTFAALEGLEGAGRPLPGVDAASLADGRPVVVNFWASWCPPCVAEHPLLVALVRDHSVRVVGVNYKDHPANARRFLGRYGNPFAAVGVDPNGRGAIEWGVYGMPETFVLDGKGRIVYKHVGPITEETLRSRLLPAIARAGRGN
jgi:cytochrome c biogenesis protein CcmG/thiol:disulfide interchange protein DsbE